MKRHWLVCGIVALCCLTGAAQEISSGLQPGDMTPVFPVFDLTGPNKGQTLCYI